MPWPGWSGGVKWPFAFFETRDHSRGDLGRPGARPRSWPARCSKDGVEGLDLGGSSAQSVILMAIVIALTVVLFQ
jgi:sn-glycerol 3-phosphate transport system permease protein